MCRFHTLATKWTNTTICILCPINNDPELTKNTKELNRNSWLFGAKDCLVPYTTTAVQLTQVKQEAPLPQRT